MFLPLRICSAEQYSLLIARTYCYANSLGCFLFGSRCERCAP